MRIENTCLNRNVSGQLRKNTGNRAGKFQETLAAGVAQKRTEDTFSAISPAVVTETAAPQETITKTKILPSSTTILPGDTTDVKLAKLKQIAETADYTGMSCEEIYTEMWNRYNNAFDGKLEAICSCLYGGEEWCSINNQFVYEMGCLDDAVHQEVTNATGLHPGDEGFADYSRMRFNEIRSAPLGYSGMSYEEKEQAIYAKYADKNTLLDFVSMQGELFHTGVLTQKLGLDGAWSYQRSISWQITETYFWDEYRDGLPITQAHYNSVLNTKFDARSFFTAMKQSLKNITFSNYSFDVEAVISQGIDDFLTMLDRQEKEIYHSVLKIQRRE